MSVYTFCRPPRHHWDKEMAEMEVGRVWIQGGKQKSYVEIWNNQQIAIKHSWQPWLLQEQSYRAAQSPGLNGGS